MRACIHKATGRLIEAQQNDSGDLQVLLNNALAAGYQANDVETKVITLQEFNTLLESLKPMPDLSNMDNIEKSIKAVALMAGTWAGKTPAQIKTAFKAAYEAL